MSRLTKAYRSLRFETEWLRGYARTYLPCEAMFTFCPEDLRNAGIALVDIRNLFSKGVVIAADKLDGPGARWVVVGDDGDGRILRAEITVNSQEHRVTLHSVITEGNRGEDNDAA